MGEVLTSDALSPGELLGAFQSSLEVSGGVVSFCGQVRPINGAGQTVTTLHLQAHPSLTDAGILNAKAEAHSRWPLEASMIRHRIGDMAPGDTIVFVATASAHRRAAFESADFLMDYLKTKAVFWKKEITDTGAAWIEPRREDHSDYARWASA
ncbi:MAG: molybdenum cofactor biosynthesis protein MoaE [Pseudomonadota bacterium]